MISHNVLGDIDVSAPGTWDGTIPFADRTVMVDLTLDSGDASAESVREALRIADDLAACDRRARAALAADAEEGPDAATVLFADHHLAELSDDALVEIFGHAVRGDITPAKMLSRMALVRVGIYPESPDGAVRLDYALDADVTNYLLCVSLDAEGGVSAVDMES